MKKMKIITICIVLAGVTYIALGAATVMQTTPQGKDVTLTGKLSCTFCAMAHPDKPCPPGCCAECVKAGDPPMFTDEAGNSYVLLTGEQGVALMTAERIAMLGGQVTIHGLAASQNGIKAIYVQSMEKAEQKNVTVTGKFSCTFCSLAHPDSPCPPGCCAECVKAGDPPSLTDASGKMYLLITGEQGVKLMTPERIALLGGQAVVKGLFTNRNGINVIFVDSIQKAGVAAAN